MAAQTVVCDSCGKSYKLKPELLGKRVKCASCGTAFMANPVAQQPQTPDVPPRPIVIVQDETPTTAGVSAAAPAASGPLHKADMGPTDRQIRLGSLAVVPLTVLATIMIMVMENVGLKGLLLLALGPFAICYGIAGIIDPNIVRAAGKYGSRLPKRYTLIAVAVGSVALVISGCLSGWLYLSQL